MKCPIDGKEFSNLKSFANHFRWHKGIMNKENFFGINEGPKNGMWKENAGYSALHEWIKKRKPKTKLCEICKKIEPFDLANISGKYLRDINDYEWICRKCHMEKDGRMKKFKELPKRYLPRNNLGRFICKNALVVMDS